jgi:hypothetical protein
MKKSLDGFDRKFARRDSEVTDGPHVAGDRMEMGWTLVYHQEGLPSFVVRGRSSVRYSGGKIVHLEDSYDPSMDEAFAAWQRESGVNLDPSYV